MEPSMILITTAGKIGAEASRLLAQRGAPVRVLVRNPEKVATLAEAGVEVCRGDLEVPATIDAAIAASPAAHAGKTYWPTGPEVLSAKGVAAVFSRVLGRTITFRPITVAQQKQAMLDVGLPENVAEDNARAVALMAEGDCDYVTNDVATILGRPPRSFEQFANDYAAAFSPTLVA